VVDCRAQHHAAASEVCHLHAMPTIHVTVCQSVAHCRVRCHHYQDLY
jgi:hypothetical protein